MNSIGGQPNKFLFFAHYKGTITRLDNLGMITLKSKEDLEHMQDTLSKRPNIDTFDWFCFSFKDRRLPTYKINPIVVHRM